uniref:C2H2-type domain-containing protein n=1 Tax=viral metagenome TaxID=1070528 RepID=A0A6C0IFT1_9ZZZZ
MISNKNVGESSETFCCEKCKYYTVKKYNFDKHNLTSKHLNSMFSNENVAKSSKSSKEHTDIYTCNNCNKNYKDPSGLWRHKKKCLVKNCDDEIITENISNTQLIDLIVKQSKENIDLKNLLLEQNKMMMEFVKDKNTVINNTNTSTNTNSHNKTFNLQFFLNETCKNAMNMSDFVNSIKLQLSDLESVGKLGYIEGLSKIIIKNLNALDVTERPVHCSDSKRDTMYVKDEDKWEKENEENHKVLKAIEDIANKNSKMVKEWKQKNPECASSKSHKADVYSHIMIQAVCSNNDVNNNKILKKIAKEVTIDKY